jgi:glycosyltransferase involved in cell wall biosynthesis
MRRAFLVRTSASVGRVTTLLMEPCSDDAVAEMERDFGVIVRCVPTEKPSGRDLSRAVRRWSSSARDFVRDLESRERFDFVLVENVENCQLVAETVSSRMGVDMDDVESVGVLQHLRLEWTKNLAIDTSDRLAWLPWAFRRVLIPLRRTPKLLGQSGRMLATWVRLRRLQRWALDHCDLVLVASESDRELLGDRRNVSVVPNGFDLLPDEREATATPRHGGNRIAFWGSMFYGPNGDGAKWLVQDVVPELRDLGVNASVLIIGNGGSELGLPSMPGVEVTGFVDDLASLLGEVDAALVPLRMGTGTRIKILEAWAKGIPVVSTTVGAYGLDARHGHDLLIGDDPRAFAAAVHTVLSDTALAAALATNGRRRVQDMTWDRSAESLRYALEKQIGAKG